MLRVNLGQYCVELHYGTFLVRYCLFDWLLPGGRGRLTNLHGKLGQKFVFQNKD